MKCHNEILSIIVISILLLCGCSKTESTIGGAAVGTGLGAGVGALLGGRGGAIVGGTLGGLTGAMVGKASAEKEENDDKNKQKEDQIQIIDNNIEILSSQKEQIEIDEIDLEKQLLDLSWLDGKSEQKISIQKKQLDLKHRKTVIERKILNLRKQKTTLQMNNKILILDCDDN